MENLLEMAKSDGKTRNFLHECYMTDPDHVGTGFGRWLEENKEVLPVYLECMEQLEGRVGYLQEVRLEFYECGEGSSEIESDAEADNYSDLVVGVMDYNEDHQKAHKYAKEILDAFIGVHPSSRKSAKIVSAVRDIDDSMEFIESFKKRIKDFCEDEDDYRRFETEFDAVVERPVDIADKFSEATVKLFLNKKDASKLDEKDPEYVAVFEIVKDIITEIVNNSVKGEKIDIGGMKFNNFSEFIGKFDRKNRYTVVRPIIINIYSNKIKGTKCENLIARLFKNNFYSEEFLLGIFKYIKDYADNDNNDLHESLSDIIYKGKIGRNIEFDIDSFARYAFLHAIGPRTYYANENSDIEEEGNDNVRENENDSIRELDRILRETLPDYQYYESLVLDQMEKNPSTSIRVIKSSIRTPYINELRDNISNSNIFSDDEKNKLFSKIADKKNPKAICYTDPFEAALNTLTKNKSYEYSIRLLGGTKYIPTVNIEKYKELWNDLDKTDRKKLEKGIPLIMEKIKNGLEDFHRSIGFAGDYGLRIFINDLLETDTYKECENNNIDIEGVLSDFQKECGYDPCWFNNFGNAIMEYIFGIGDRDERGKHIRLKTCIEEATKPSSNQDTIHAEGNVESDSIENTTDYEQLIHNIYERILQEIEKAIGGTETAKKKIKRLGKKTIYEFSKFDTNLISDDILNDEVSDENTDLFDKEAYIQMFDKAGLSVR